MSSATDRNNEGLEPAGELGELEQTVMNYVWQSGPVTADQCREAIGRGLKDSTIRTVLRRLEDKGYVVHDVNARTFLYRAAEPKQQVAARAIQKILDRFCEGSVEQLLVGLVDREIVSEDELERLARRIAKAKEGRK